VEDIIIFRTTADLGGQAETDTPQVEVQASESDPWQAANAEGSSPATDAEGHRYTTLKEYLERNKERHENRVYYATDETSQTTYIDLHKNQGLEVLFLDSFIDTPHFINFLEREYSDLKFSRVDADLDDSIVDQDKSGEIVDPKTNKTRSEQIKEVFEQAINRPRVNVKVQALKADDPQGTPPAMVLLPEETRRMQEMMAMMQQDNFKFPDEHILMVNSNHPLVQNVLAMSQGSIIQGAGVSSSGDTAALLAQHIYDLALMAQRGFDADSMKTFVGRSNQVLTKLTER
jgi:molecular chaperone HtpG